MTQSLKIRIPEFHIELVPSGLFTSGNVSLSVTKTGTPGEYTLSGTYGGGTPLQAYMRVYTDDSPTFSLPSPSANPWDDPLGSPEGISTSNWTSTRTTTKNYVIAIMWAIFPGESSFAAASTPLLDMGLATSGSSSGTSSGGGGGTSGEVIIGSVPPAKASAKGKRRAR